MTTTTTTTAAAAEEGTPSLTRADKKLALLDALRREGLIVRAAREVGVSRVTVYAWRDADPAFALEMQAAREDALEELEGVLWDRARSEKGMPGVIAGLALQKRYHPELWNDRLVVQDDGRSEVAAAMREYTQLAREVFGAARAEQLAASAKSAPAEAEDASIIEGEARELPAPSSSGTENTAQNTSRRRKPRTQEAI